MHQGIELNLQIELAHLRAECDRLAQHNAELRERNTRLLSMLQELEAREQ